MWCGVLNILSATSTLPVERHRRGGRPRPLATIDEIMEERRGRPPDTSLSPGPSPAQVQRVSAPLQEVYNFLNKHLNYSSVDASSIISPRVKMAVADKETRNNSVNDQVVAPSSMEVDKDCGNFIIKKGKRPHDSNFDSQSDADTDNNADAAGIILQSAPKKRVIKRESRLCRLLRTIP